MQPAARTLVRIRYSHSVQAHEVIVEARQRAGLTQAEVARRIGTTQSAIARLERGENDPSWARVNAIVEACELELTIGLDDPDRAELASLRRNLDLSTDERWTRVVNSGRFVLAGRAAMNASRG